MLPKIFLPLLYATFECRRYNIFKKKLNLFFAHENIKKWPQKLLIIGPKLFFHSTAWPPKPAQNRFFILWICPKTHVSSYLCILVWNLICVLSKVIKSRKVFSILSNLLSNYLAKLVSINFFVCNVDNRFLNFMQMGGY